MNLAFQAGGLVMWPLFMSSIISMACIFERILYWRSVNWHDKYTIKKILRIYSEDFNSLEMFLLKNTNCPLSVVLLNSIEYEKSTSENFHLALSSSIQAIIPKLKRFNDLFSTIITVAPLLGLLGTILGLIKSFSLLELEQINVSSEGVTGGISEALISTAAGLIIAILTLLFANFFKALYKNQLNIIEEYSVKIELIRSKKYNYKK
tara:strand:+ start:471 stop:1091 length:621 start_codon:yes stop_codon:yes gene_type:complete